MNKSDRTRLAMALRRLGANIGKEANAFRHVVESLLTAEDDKLDNLPESLKDSSMALSIAESRDSLGDLLGKVDGLAALVDEIASEWDIDLDRGKALTNAPEAYEPAVRVDEKKTERIFMLVTPSTRKALDEHAKATGLSMNQVLNTSVGRYLDGAEE